MPNVEYPSVLFQTVDTLYLEHRMKPPRGGLPTKALYLQQHWQAG
jgi:hypothetical protein